jgi:hypothetical protein
MRGRGTTFAPQLASDGRGPAPRRLLGSRAPTLRQVARRLTAGTLRRCSLLRRRKLHSSSPGLRQADGNGLLRRSGAVLSLAHMMDFFSDELSSLGGGRFALTLVASGSLDCFSLWHRLLRSGTAPECRRGWTRWALGSGLWALGGAIESPELTARSPLMLVHPCARAYIRSV